MLCRWKLTCVSAEGEGVATTDALDLVTFVTGGTCTSGFDFFSDILALCFFGWSALLTTSLGFGCTAVSVEDVSTNGGTHGTCEACELDGW